MADRTRQAHTCTRPPAACDSTHYHNCGRPPRATELNRRRAGTTRTCSTSYSDLGSESPARIRLLAKFVGNTYEKADKLFEMREAAQGRLREVEEGIEVEKVRLVCVVQLAHLMLSSSTQILSSVQQMLWQRDKSLKDIVTTLQVYRVNVDEDPCTKDSEKAIIRWTVAAYHSQGSATMTTVSTEPHTAPVSRRSSTVHRCTARMRGSSMTRSGPNTRAHALSGVLARRVSG